MLVTCSGTVGSVTLGYSAHAGCAVSSDLLRVDIQDSRTRSYVYAFLRTGFGQAMMRGSHYGTIVKHLRPSHLEGIPVPMVEHLNAEIDDRVQQAFAARDEAYRLDMAARCRFAEAMGDEVEMSTGDTFSVASSDLFDARRRLEAAAHSPAARHILLAYERNASSVAVLGELAQVVSRGRFKRIYGDIGTPYLDSGPLFKINPGVTKRLTRATRIDFDTYMVRRGWLLMACSGQTSGINGQTILANEWHEGKIVTQHIMRIIPDTNQIRAGYLQTMLSHPTLGKPLVVSRAYGTSVPELAPGDVERLPIPRLGTKLEAEIADSAERANDLRLEADLNENHAVSQLEEYLEARLGIAEGEARR